MANVKISDLTDAGTITGAETLEVVQSTNSRKVTVANLRSGLAVLEALTATRTYYVRTDGSDSNDGLTNSSGGAFLTLQKAINTVAGLNIGAHSVEIQVANGTYTNGVSVTSPWLGTGTVTLTGDTTTPANCIISRTSATCISVTNGGRLTVRGFQLQTTTSGDGIAVSTGGRVTVSGIMRLGAIAGTAAFQSASGGTITISAAVTTTAGMPRWIAATDFGTVSLSGSVTHVFTGTWAWGSAAVLCSRIGLVLGNPTLDISGATITGTRYDASLNSVIQTFGSGTSYFPGSVAGSTATGAQYA
jgi:hypothetical protein